MRSIGIRDLKQQTSRIVRQVRRGETVEITFRGRPVARLVPAVERLNAERTSAAVWSDLDRLAEEISAHWRGRRSASGAVRQGRRDL